MMNFDEAYEKKMDAVWEKFRVSLALEKMRKIEQLENKTSSRSAAIEPSFVMMISEPVMTHALSAR